MKGRDKPYAPLTESPVDTTPLYKAGCLFHIVNELETITITECYPETDVGNVNGVFVSGVFVSGVFV